MLPYFLCFATLLFFSKTCLAACIEDEAADEPRTYIVFVRQPDDTTMADPKLLEAWHRSFLPEAPTNSSLSRLVYSYSHAVSGFAARLTEEEVKEMGEKEGFLKALPDRNLHLQTTHTPAFLGLQPESGLWKRSDCGKGAIIGMMDTGVAALHPSFDDSGVPPPPARWKGECTLKGPSGRCNNKLIGARKFLHGSDDKTPPVDINGHGTHTASTAAGNFVPGAELFENINGTAAGMAPHAHLAIYKVCDTRCANSDIVAGIDAAIKDGVDVMSISFGTSCQQAFHEDPVTIATFAAAEKGILVSCAAGNVGPPLTTVTNSAPWVLTVGASTVDRTVRATVKLGDGQEFDGQSVYQPLNFSSAPLPLVFPKNEEDLSDCLPVLNSSHVKNKMVLCGLERGDIGEIGQAVKSGGGAAMILGNEDLDGYTTLAEPVVLPASHVSSRDALKIVAYMKSATNPTASISFKGTMTGISPAPCVASFSSRGPNWASRGILKPDIIGPGTSILAAWPYPVGSSGKANFNSKSGTSMSTPHLSGIAALLKSVHPDWSPAAIKSAIMTTADTRIRNGEWIKDEQLQPASYFLMGAGHVNPSKAADPGLVYDLDVEDYIAYLCGLGYNDNQVEYFTGRRVTCANIKAIGEADLNYPSIIVQLSSGEVTVNRTVTNVGDAVATYKVEVEMKTPKGVSITVSPETLHFSKLNEKRSFTVTVNTKKGQSEGSLKWVSDKHTVKSPIIVMPPHDST